MFIIDPPATAGGTDLLQVQLLTLGGKAIQVGNLSQHRSGMRNFPLTPRTKLPSWALFRLAYTLR